MKHLLTLRQQIDRWGGQKALAAGLGISPGFLSDVMCRRKDISLPLALKLETRCGMNGLRLLQQQTEWRYAEFKKSSNKEE